MSGCHNPSDSGYAKVEPETDLAIFKKIIDHLTQRVDDLEERVNELEEGDDY